MSCRLGCPLIILLSPSLTSFVLVGENNKVIPITRCMDRRWLSLALVRDCREPRSTKSCWDHTDRSVNINKHCWSAHVDKTFTQNAISYHAYRFNYRPNHSTARQRRSDIIGVFFKGQKCLLCAATGAVWGREELRLLLARCNVVYVYAASGCVSVENCVHRLGSQPCQTLVHRHGIL